MKAKTLFLAILFFLPALSQAAQQTTQGGMHFTQDPIALTAHAQAMFSVDFGSFLEGGEKPLSWSSSDLPKWLSLNESTGVLSGAPSLSDLGTMTFHVSVTAEEDGVLNQPVVINVVKLAPPVWAQNPIVLPDARVGALYAFNVSSYILNPETSPITFSLVSGPAWLVTRSDGTVSGVPSAANLGANSFVVRATNSEGASSQVETQLKVVAH